MKILGIIPARYASTRFPGKALFKIDGKAMITRVYEQAVRSKLIDKVVVATDDERIFNEIAKAGGTAIMTSPDHTNGTERCAEVALNESSYDYFINIQGDEPYIHPDQVDLVAELLNGEVELATLVKKVEDLSVLDDPTEMKVIFNNKHEALFFSRNCIPHVRDVPLADRLNHFDFYKHIGIYGYRRDVLLEIANLPPTPLEMAERLEQLRWIEHGYRIKIGFTTLESQMIDTPEDLQKLKLPL